MYPPRRWFSTSRANLSSIQTLSRRGVYPAPKDPGAEARMWLEKNGRLLCSAFVQMLKDSELQIDLKRLLFEANAHGEKEVIWATPKLRSCMGVPTPPLCQSLKFSVDGTFFAYADQGRDNIVFKGGRYALRFEKQMCCVSDKAAGRNRAHVRPDENCVKRLYSQGLGTSLCRGYLLFSNPRANEQFVKELPPKGSYAFISVSIMESCAVSVREYIRRIEDTILEVIIRRLNVSGPFLSPDVTNELYWKKYGTAASKIGKDIREIAGANSAQAQSLLSTTSRWMNGDLRIAKMRLDVLQEKIDVFYPALRRFLTNCLYVDFHSGNLMLCDGGRLKLVDEDAIKSEVPPSILNEPRLRRVGNLFIYTVDPNFFLFRHWIVPSEHSSAFVEVALRALGRAEGVFAKKDGVSIPFLQDDE